MKQTVLHQKHLQLKARMTDFQGWQVPLAFSDAQEEHHAVRTAAGLFDVSFLGRIEISGPHAASLLEQVFTRNIARMADRSAHYGFLCNEAGFVLDDEVLYRFSNGQAGGRFLLSANAVNTDKVVAWLKKNAAPDTEVVDRTSVTGQLALQGPLSASILEKFLGPRFKKFKPRTLREIPLSGQNMLISRTGYTGEHGYEFFVPAGQADELWEGLLQAGGEFGLRPCGLASRDSLRIEMGYLLYGNDLDETRTPIDAGRESFVDFKKSFIGRDALLKQRQTGTAHKLAGFELFDKGVPRNGGSIFSENREIGDVTSGCLSPSLHKGIGLGYLHSRYAQSGQEIEIEIRDREIAAKIVELPFYRKK